MKPLATLTSGFAASLLCVLCAQAQEPPAPPPGPSPLQQPPPRPRPTAPAPPSGPVLVNSIAAKVNGHVITTNEVNFAVRPMANQLAAMFPRRGPEFERQLNQARDGILQEMIDRQIILDEYKTMGANIKDYYVDEDIKQQVRTLFNGDEAKFQEELKRSRMTMDGFRRMTKEKMIVQAMRAHQFSDAPPPLPEEVQKEYNEIKNTLRDTNKDLITFKKIYIPKVNPKEPAATPEIQLALAESLVKELQQGADFAELAKKHSSDAFGADGGLWQDVPRPDLSPEFAAIIFDTKEGKLVGPLEDPNGYTLAIPIKITLGPAPPLDGKIREVVEQRVHRKKTSDQYEHWIASRRKKAMIKIMK